MSDATSKDSEEESGKARLKMALIAVAVVLAVGVAIWSGVHSVQPKVHVIGILGADGKSHYYSDGQATPPPDPNAVPLSKQ